MLIFTLFACEGLTEFLEDADTDTDVDTDTDTDVDTDVDSDTDADTDVEGPAFTGTVAFQAPLPRCLTDCFLDYDGAAELPVRHHRVAFLGASGQVLSEGVTDANGSFRLVYDGPETEGTLFVYADATLPGGSASVVVSDNTDGADWGTSGGVVDLSTPIGGLDLLIEHGFNGTSYDHRASGPFAITDAVLQGSEAYLDAVPAGTLPTLTVFWSPDNRPESGDDALGLIGTSFYRDSEVAIYLLGAEDIDTDEFDRHVMLHEWTHFFQDRVSRSDSSGGSHPYGAVLDPTVAWSEGSATTLASLVYADFPYTDTRGASQVGGFDNDVEDDFGAVPGWWSERAVQRWLNDLYDDASEFGDAVDFGIPALFEDLEDQRESEAFVTLFSVGEAVAIDHPNAAASIDLLSESFGFDPITDAYGTGETHDAGSTWNLPVYTALTAADQTVHLDGTLSFNRLGRHRFLRFDGTGQSSTVTATSQEDVDLRVYERGVELDSARAFCTSPPCTETVTIPTTVGVTYTVLLEGHGDPADYTATVRVTP